MNLKSFPLALGAALALALAAVALFTAEQIVVAKEPAAQKEASPAKAPSEAAVARSKKTVQMLDNIYKQTIVLVTDKYVNDTDDFAAGSAAVLLFKNISDGGSHNVRLLDATGEPYDDNNVAKDDFEREGIKRLKAGDKIYEKVVEKDGKPYLRAITPVPVVLKKCAMCHDHYNDAKPGEPIGAISYVVPIE